MVENQLGLPVGVSLISVATPYVEKIRVPDRLHEKAFFLVGVGPLRSDRAASFMREHVPGVHIPDEVVDRLRKTPKSEKRDEGKRVCVETIQQARETNHFVTSGSGLGAARISLQFVLDQDFTRTGFKVLP